jgi:hypothetical protein
MPFGHFRANRSPTHAVRRGSISSAVMSTVAQAGRRDESQVSSCAFNEECSDEGDLHNAPAIAGEMRAAPQRGASTLDRKARCPGPGPVPDRLGRRPEERHTNHPATGRRPKENYLPDPPIRGRRPEESHPTDPRIRGRRPHGHHLTASPIRGRRPEEDHLPDPLRDCGNRGSRPGDYPAGPHPYRCAFVSW